ncbi:MAG: hypothetical protein DLM53_12380 [Candidatus Eremiobacter antarcticus]|nr:MAG: hypothetical protein DLM53_12380 [Candidatus Eremiobacter sp. RRmetagenome_bin22]
MAAGMFWQVGWSLVLGFAISGFIQAFVSKERMRRQLGASGLREVALATALGAASSSCSYAAAAVSKSLFKKGAGLIPSLAFLFASTNLVVELGIIIYLLMGWQFTVAEWVGGIVLIAVMSLLVKFTYPARLVEEARGARRDGRGWARARRYDGRKCDLRRKAAQPASAHLGGGKLCDGFSMLWKDLLAGFLIAGALAVLVPYGVWQALFLNGAPAFLQVPLNAVVVRSSRSCPSSVQSGTCRWRLCCGRRASASEGCLRSYTQT